MKRTNRHILYALASVSFLAAIGCANRGMGPQGGPKDETPPKVVKEEPLSGTVDYHNKKIEITFDEYLQLNDVANQVLISPPQQRPPEVRAVGKKVTVTFEEDLRDSTTYTIDFGSAICDNNERNPLQGYTFSFATGPEIDTLQLSGIVVNAENLNPVSDIYVGIHLNHADSAFETTPFTRIARTNEKGEFTIQNIHRGTYRLYGLNDVSRDYVYQPGEGLAMIDTLFTPTVHEEGRVDTLFLADSVVVALDSLQRDSLPHDSLGRYWEKIESKTVPVYEPNNVLLMYFTEDKQRHYFIRCLREEQHFFKLLFSAPQDSLPTIVAIHSADSVPTDSVLLAQTDTVQTNSANWLDHAVFQPSQDYDTITVWLTDSSVIRQDTLAMVMTYMLSDSVYNLQPQTDTVFAVYRAPRLSDKAKAEIEKRKATERHDLKLKQNSSSTFDIFDSLRITSPTPIRVFHPEMLHLSVKKDSTYRPLKIQPLIKGMANMQVVVPYKWEAEKEYRLTVDSAAFTDVYGWSNQEMEIDLKIRSLEDYSTLIAVMEPFDSTARIQLLNEKDIVVREMPAKEGGTRFEYLKPGTYYMRLYLDINGDGHWTTGDFLKHRAPEPVYYYSGKLSLRANWDFEESFDITAKPLLEQKPAELKQTEGSKEKK